MKEKTLKDYIISYFLLSQPVQSIKTGDSGYNDAYMSENTVTFYF